MYEVILINGNEETVINAISSDINAPKITGSIKRGINTINSFTFNIFPNNPGYSLIDEFKTKVRVTNIITNKAEFLGRVLIPRPSMSESGIFKTTVICESELGYLHDSKQRYGEYHGISIRNFLKLMLDTHNETVEEEKRFELGIVEVTDSNDSLFRYLNYESTFNNIMDKLVDRLGGELRVRWENGIRYLDYLKQVGEVKSTEIRLSKNMKTLELEKDPTKIISRLVPLGAKHEDSDERLTIADVNNGLDYIVDEDAINKIGVKEDSNVWDDVTIPENLLSKGKEFLRENNRILKKYKLDALDLYALGLDIDNFEEGNSYPVINPVMDIDDTLRVVEINLIIENPQASNLSIGDKFEDIKSYQKNISKTSKSLESVKNTVNSTIDVVGSVSGDLVETVEVLNNTIEVLGNTNSTVAQLNDQLITISQALQNNINTTVELVNTTNSISSNLNITNTKLEKLKRRVVMEV